MPFQSLYPRQKIILGVLIFFVIIIIGVGIILPRVGKNKVVSGQLLVWGLDSKQAVAPLIDSFVTRYPKVEVVYETKNASTYETDLISAFSRGQGPDVFVVNNAKINEYFPYISPCNLGGSTESVNSCFLKNKVYTKSQLESDFPDIVLDDFSGNGELYGLPLSVDTLGLYYNKDFFNKANIASPPTVWDGKSTLSVETVARKLRLLKSLVLTRAGIALGGESDTIENANDILALMMMQKGAALENSVGETIFDSGEFLSPSTKALSFYIDFANPKSTNNNYNWGQGVTAANAFWQGKTAMYLGYYRDKIFIDRFGGDLNYGYTKIPQFVSATQTGNTVNYANYYGFVVSKQSKLIDPAWQFVMGATENDVANRYYQVTKNPPAKRSLISATLNNDLSGVFVQQILTARSFKGPSQKIVVEAFDRMIYDALHGVALNEAVSKAARTINSY